uniref:50S ribosomal protein L35 n=1 Tax=Spumella sp. Baekdong012001B8 TaxID=2782410 RepID=A0A7S6PV74_9STRA|nr:ribosomal protein L35 [Spumella sp. Baekdong012001B8]
MLLKLKTQKSAAKRIKVKKRFFSRKSSFLGHLRRKKSARRKRALKAPKKIHLADLYTFSVLLPYH